jgi:sugar/nucleoside kinase (ribokinase family)
MADCDIVVAGHLCLDVTPKFPDTGATRLAQIMRPGSLVQVGECVVSSGGSVANTGIALRKLGLDVSLMGKLGNDRFGELLRGVLRDQGCGGAVVVPGENTSYTLVIAPPGLDRMFLHNAGANDTFCADDVDYEAVAGAKMLHLGYPPMMATLYADDGEQLELIFRRAKESGATTSLDMTLPDPEGASGRVNWRRVLERVLPHVDLFLPSAEEVFYCLEPEQFLQMRAQADAEGCSMPDLFDAGRMRRLADELLEMGAGVATLKSGHRGIYLRTSGEARLRSFGRAAPGDPADWAGRELWEPAYAIERIASATGSGDCAIAGFLAAFVRGEAVERCLRYATATGRQNLGMHDATSGILPWQETTEMLEDLPKAELHLDDPGWRWDESARLWRGPAE